MVKLFDQLRAAIRVRHYSIRTEQAYLDWARHYILFHGKRHTADMAAEDFGRPRQRIFRRSPSGLEGGTGLFRSFTLTLKTVSKMNSVQKRTWRKDFRRSKNLTP